ncbi:MAG TPA: PspC domain-containing protein, partial [Pedococcus sp.]
MTQNPGQTAGSPPQQLSGLDRFFGWLRSLDVRRATDDKWLAGVCSGIARRLGVDPLVVRAGLIVLILLGGLGVTLYLVAWALLPTEDGSIVAERGLREGDAGGILLLVLIALSVVGGSGLFDGQGWGLWWQWWLVVPIGLLTVWLVTRGRSSSSTGGAAYEPPPASAAAHPGWAPAALPPGAVAATASTAPAGPATTSGPTVPGTVGPMAPGAMGPGAMGPGAMGPG